MKKVSVFVSVLSIFGSCTLPQHVPHPPTLDPSRVAVIKFSEPVHFINSQNTQEDIVVPVESFNLSINLHEYTEAVITGLKSEFDRNGYPYSDAASKTMRITVADVSLGSFMGGNVCNLDLVIQPGELRVIGIQASAKSLNYQKAIDYAVADAIIKILSHSEITRFLEGR